MQQAQKALYTGPGSSQARDWVQDKKAPRTEYNLLSLTGGKYLLKTDAEWQRLYELLAEDYLAERRSFFVECRTPVFPAVFDVDLKHPTHDLSWIQEEVLPGLCRGVARALVMEPTKVSFLLTTAPTVDCDLGSGKGAGKKSGCHVHFLQARARDGSLADIIVDGDRGLAIRQRCIEELVKQHGKDSGLDWENIVDPVVFKDNGKPIYMSRIVDLSLQSGTAGHGTVTSKNSVRSGMSTDSRYSSASKWVIYLGG